MLGKEEFAVRAQLMKNNGDLIQDFDIRIRSDIIIILNAPSPAETSSIAIGQHTIKYANL